MDQNKTPASKSAVVKETPLLTEQMKVATSRIHKVSDAAVNAKLVFAFADRRVSFERKLACCVKWSEQLAVGSNGNGGWFIRNVIVPMCVHRCGAVASLAFTRYGVQW